LPKKKYIQKRWLKKHLKVIVLGAATHKTVDVMVNNEVDDICQGKDISHTACV